MKYVWGFGIGVVYKNWNSMNLAVLLKTKSILTWLIETINGHLKEKILLIQTTSSITALAIETLQTQRNSILQTTPS